MVVAALVEGWILEAPGAMVLAERAAGADGGGKFVVGAGSEPGWLSPRAAKPAGC